MVGWGSREGNLVRKLVGICYTSWSQSAPFKDKSGSKEKLK